MRRGFLLASTFVWLPYGLFCLARPEFLADAAGVAATSPTGTTELRAMYGGLQAGLGGLTLASVLRPQLTPTALTALATLCGGLFTARALGALVDGGLSGYTAFALVFESLSTAGALWLRRHEA